MAHWDFNESEWRDWDVSSPAGGKPERIRANEPEYAAEAYIRRNYETMGCVGRYVSVEVLGPVSGEMRRRYMFSVKAVVRLSVSAYREDGPTLMRVEE
jgi:hypothetical protein